MVAGYHSFQVCRMPAPAHGEGDVRRTQSYQRAFHGIRSGCVRIGEQTVHATSCVSQLKQDALHVGVHVGVYVCVRTLVCGHGNLHDGEGRVRGAEEKQHRG